MPEATNRAGLQQISTSEPALHLDAAKPGGGIGQNVLGRKLLNAKLRPNEEAELEAVLLAKKSNKSQV